MNDTTQGIPYVQIAVHTMATICVKLQFIACHRWAAAPEAVGFLRNWHRHLFGVKANFLVTHDDRDLEFFLMQEVMSEKLKDWVGGYHEKSCEAFARELLMFLLERGYPVLGVEVDEDGENSASVGNVGLSPVVRTETLVVTQKAAMKLGALQPDLPFSTGAGQGH